MREVRKPSRAPWRQCGDLDPVDDDAAARRLKQTGAQVEQRGLARSTRPRQPDRTATRDAQPCDVDQRERAAVDPVRHNDVRQVQHGGWIGHRPSHDRSSFRGHELRPDYFSASASTRPSQPFGGRTFRMKAIVRPRSTTSESPYFPVLTQFGPYMAKGTLVS